MITKGDVLAYLGDIKSAYGTAQVHHTTMSELSGAKRDGAHAQASQPAYTPLSAPEHRRLVVAGLASLGTAPRTPARPRRLHHRAHRPPLRRSLPFMKSYRCYATSYTHV